MRLLSAIYEMYGQQRKMFEEKTHVCANTFIDHHSWDAYNESLDLSLHINKFKDQKVFMQICHFVIKTNFIHYALSIFKSNLQ